MTAALYPHQAEAVTRAGAALATERAFLQADEVGLGKTRVALEVARGYPRALIVAPLSTFGGWLADADAMGVKLAVANGDGWPSGAAYVITNYERLAKWKQVGKQVPKTNIFRAEAWPLVIFDEAHRLKSHLTARWHVYEGIRAAAGRMLFLTATPAQSPLECRYLGDIFGFDPGPGWRRWVRGFKGISKGRFGDFDWTPGSLEDTRRLETLVERNPLAIRRRPSQVRGWPELQVSVTPLRMNTAETMAYDSAFADYLEAIARAGREISPAAAALVAVGQFRKRLSEIKVRHTLELAGELLDQGRVVTVAVEYLDAARRLRDELTRAGRVVGYIDGSTPSAERQSILERSRMDQLDALVFTVQEGINAHQFQDSHRARVQIDHDIRWSAIAQHQVDGRTHRAGRSALVYWLVCGGTVDERVALRLRERMATMRDILGDGEDTSTKGLLKAEGLFPAATAPESAPLESQAPTAGPRPATGPATQLLFQF